MWFVGLVFVGLLCSPSGGFLVPSKAVARPAKGVKCELERASQMLGSYCRNLALTTVPEDINANIVILDLTFNRFRELHNTSFINYPSLQYLYLEDNIITFIDIGTFYPLPDLEVLDLRLNALHSVPEAINSLPVLRKLYLDRNPFTNVLFMDQLPSIDYLGLSGCKLKYIPSLEAMPRLQSLNMSNNNIKTVNIRDLAPLCQLRSLDLRGNKNLFARSDGMCDCSLLVKWSLIRGIKMTPNHDVICQTSFDDLKEPWDNSTCYTNETELIFQESNSVIKLCEVQVLEYGSGPIRLKGSVVWTVGIFGACAVLIICFASVYCARRRQSIRHNDRSSEGSQSLKSRS